MSETALIPLLPAPATRAAPDVPRNAEAEQALGPKIVPAFRFVPSAPPALNDAGRLERDYARAARDAVGRRNPAPDRPAPGEANAA